MIGLSKAAGVTTLDQSSNESEAQEPVIEYLGGSIPDRKRRLRSCAVPMTAKGCQISYNSGRLCATLAEGPC